jgi:hypothetical protein
MTLYVVYVPDTGHVVGAVNAVGVTLPGDAGAQSLTGRELRLRINIGAGEIATLPLAAGDLAVHAPDDQPSVFADPLAFGVEQVPGAKPKPALRELPSWKDPDLVFSTDSLVVTLPFEVTVQTPVLALVAVDQSVRVLPGSIQAGGESIQLGVTVTAGFYGVLVLVAGLAGVLTKVEKKA